MSIKHGILIGVFMSMLTGICAQEYDESTAYFYEVDSTDYETTFGPNTPYYQHGFISLGWSIPSDESDSLRSKLGGIFLEYGSRGKLKISENFALGWEASYQFSSINIVQDSTKNLLSLGNEYEKQQLKKHALNLGTHLRFNVGRRGNKLGKYLDLGGYVNYSIGSRLTIETEEDRSANNFGSSRQRLVLKRLNFTNPLEYGLNARLGLNGFIIWGRYRLSDSFQRREEVNNGIQLPNLTPITTGIQLAF